MTATKLVEALGVGRTTLWRWVRAGLIPAPTRKGREVIFDPVAVRMARSIAEAAR